MKTSDDRLDSLGKRKYKSLKAFLALITTHAAQICFLNVLRYGILKIRLIHNSL